MNIDFFTFCAQILNLLILLFLLRKFLYLPVSKVLEERRNLFENKYKEAENSRKKAAQLEEKILQEYAEMESAKQDILAKSYSETHELIQKLNDEAKNEYEKTRKVWKNKLKSEQDTFEIAMQNLMVQHFVKFSENALSQMADKNLNELFIDKLKQKISSMNEKQKSEFKNDLLLQNRLDVVTAKKLEREIEKEFSDFLRNEFLFSDNVKIKFFVDEKLICGVVLKAKEQMIEWNLLSYMNDFSKNLNSAVSGLINKD